jgi:hypothetical protein
MIQIVSELTHDVDVFGDSGRESIGSELVLQIGRFAKI